MDPATSLAVQSLVRDFVFSKNKAVSLNETQKQLHIPQPLVYLAGLSVLSKDPSKTFQELQQYYKEHVQTGSNNNDQHTFSIGSFAFSPTLLPSPKDQKRIELAVQSRETELYHLAEKTAQTLLQQQQMSPKRRFDQSFEGPFASAVSKTASKIMGPCSDTSHSSSINDDNDDDEESIDETPIVRSSREPPSSFLQNAEQSTTTWNYPLPRMAQPHDETTEGSSIGWTTVEKQRRKPVATTVSQEDRDVPVSSYLISSIKSDENEVLSKAKENHQADEDVHATDSDASRTLPVKPAVSIESKSSSPNNDTDPSRDHPSTPTLTTIQELQVQIQELQLQLERQDRLHKQQRNEKDASLQSLQLRNYIVETKLQLYEDALESHIQAVQPTTSPVQRYSRAV